MGNLQFLIDLNMYIFGLCEALACTSVPRENSHLLKENFIKKVAWNRNPLPYYIFEKTCLAPETFFIIVIQQLSRHKLKMHISLYVLET